jgi:hypothetical protein
LIPAITQDWLDGDGDALPMTVEQVGARACHTGARSCCFEASAKPSAGGAQAGSPASNAADPAATLEAACQSLIRDWRQGVAA